MSVWVAVLELLTIVGLVALTVAWWRGRRCLRELQELRRRWEEERPRWRP